MRLLIVKTSSMGDVVHALPVVHDVRRAFPGAQIEWLVEASFAAIPRLHTGVGRVLPMAWRRWRKKLSSGDSWRAMRELRAQLREQRYDCVLDLQGLLKSALWGRQASGPLMGYDSASAREPLASWFYARKAHVGRDLHAVERCRQLAAAHLGYAPPSDAPVFGIQPGPGSWKLRGPSAALIPCASRPEKIWPEARWIAVGKRIKAMGLSPLVLWGTEEEQVRAERIAAGCDGEVPPFLNVHDMAALLAETKRVVGLDTGFSHLAAALGRPTIGIYCDHEPGLAGLVGTASVASVGGKGLVPSQQEVLSLVERQAALP
ncbi:MAG: lipopolysaccharide heptosyltransferase I [Ideonella sp.]|nr:lipopolysaccharide heptosyltransferase I [Ideonella sp.]MCC7456573.1 lipopolysaccharide heptosyltransferase I [Nitrospira sp.]